MTEHSRATTAGNGSSHFRLLRTSSFRLTLWYVLLFSAAVCALGGVVYWEVSTHAAEHQDELIEDDVQTLIETDGAHDVATLAPFIQQRVATLTAAHMHWIIL